ncbi:NAD kinase [Vulcanibacillus modesticaldus]|uniref:NAD kinase n=1 Tax=Vulcanibacillus modesticaldus TaxID=337097 RepID=A0A1D2YWK8_9BACI|nr:NAD kinase [Vulcanibacillus modesticaldus]OEG00036.1 NAD kinase [Vulcanibacillus modesticaldus]
MKYTLVYREDELSNDIKDQFHKYASENNLIEDSKSPDLIISIGGDGTMLEAFHANKHRLDKVAFLGIHTGHLGFYADWQPNELEMLASLIATKPLQYIEYPLVKINIITENEEVQLLALNEFTVKNIEKTLVMKIKINHEDFEMFRGDGLCISTPSGSTGYNKSLGGAVIHPTLESIQVSEMASINNRVYRTIGSPLLLPKHHCIDLYPQHKTVISLTLDHLSMQMKDIISIQCTVADEKIRFARYRPFPFWNRVRDAFIGSQHMD